MNNVKTNPDPPGVVQVNPVNQVQAQQPPPKLKEIIKKEGDNLSTFLEPYIYVGPPNDLRAYFGPFPHQQTGIPQAVGTGNKQMVPPQQPVPQTQYVVQDQQNQLMFHPQQIHQQKLIQSGQMPINMQLQHRMLYQNTVFYFSLSSKTNAEDESESEGEEEKDEESIEEIAKHLEKIVRKAIQKGGVQTITNPNLLKSFKGDAMKVVDLGKFLNQKREPTEETEPIEVDEFDHENIISSSESSELDLMEIMRKTETIVFDLSDDGLEEDSEDLDEVENVKEEDDFDFVREVDLEEKLGETEGEEPGEIEGEEQIEDGVNEEEPEIDDSEEEIVDDDEEEEIFNDTESEDESVIDVEEDDDDDYEEEDEIDNVQSLRAKKIAKKVQEIINREKKIKKEKLRVKELYKNYTKFGKRFLRELEEYSRNESNPHIGDAVYYLGKIHFYELKNFEKGKHHFLRAAVLGHPKSQFKVSFLLENDLIDQNDWEVVNRLRNRTLNYEKFDKKALSLLYLFFSAMGDYPKAQISMGYKSFYGIDSKKKCEAAVTYYSLAAGQFEIGNFQTLSSKKYRLDNPKSLGEKENERNLMDFFKYSAKKGDDSSSILLGYAHLFGLRGLPQNREIARGYFERAVDNGNQAGFAPLGSIYALGYGVDQDNETALKYFKEGADRNDAKSMNGLGFMYLNGAGVDKDLQQAFYYFNKSAYGGNPEGNFNLGNCYLQGRGIKKNYAMAGHFMRIAHRSGVVRASKTLGEMHKKGMGTPKSCTTAIKYYKEFVEKFLWAKSGDKIFAKYKENDLVYALNKFLELAMMGEEVSSLNAAYLLENDQGVSFYHNQSAPLRKAFDLYKKASQQGAIDAHLKVGDFFYYGVGTDDVDFDLAAHYYRRASNAKNPQATFNLGYLHETGKGMPKDFFLSKRYYDLTLKYNANSYLAVYLALAKLFVKWGWKLLMEYGKEMLDTLGEEL